MTSLLDDGYIQWGERGPEILELQNYLSKALNKPIDPDGIFGSETLAAVKEYQTKLFVTGRVDRALFDKLKKSHEDSQKDKETPTQPSPLNITWLGGPNPVNQTKGRRGVDIDTLVLHFTASVDFRGTVNWFLNPTAQVSAHYIINYNGAIAQMVKDEDTAWHAGGTTTSDGASYTNTRSIGIEIENWGKLREKKGVLYHPIADIEYDSDVHGEPFARKTSSGDVEYWMPFTIEQITAVKDLGKALHKKYNFKYIVSHEEIALLKDGRRFKQDTGPAFPLDSVRKYIKP